MNPEKKGNEVEKFFNDLPNQDDAEADIFGDQKVERKPAAVGSADGTTEVPAKGQSQEDENEPRKNRRHRRLEEQLERERQSNIALNERLMKVLEGKTPGSESSSSEMPPEWIALYGETPEAQKAWKVQERMLNSVKTQAKEEAIKEIEDRQSQAVAEKQQFESFIDSQLEALEDTYNVDLTSDAPAARKSRREFLEMVTNLSPKDESGNIAGYADFGSTFDLYQKTKTTETKPDDTVSKAKEIAARSMQQSGQGAQGSDQKITPGFRGWQKDYNL